MLMRIVEKRDTKQSNSVRAYPALLLILLWLISTAHARIITVDDDGPADFNNIQAAIDDANDGDTVEVQPGLYTGQGNCGIGFKGKAITVRSTNPDDFGIVAATVIDCSGAGTGVYFDSGEDVNSVLSGLTITNGNNMGEYPGGIYCIDSSPVISNCIIVRNSGGWGGGIGSRYGDLVVRNCIIANNTASNGGGIYGSNHNSLTIESCTITANTARVYGGAIRSSAYHRLIKNCTISGNKADHGGGVSCRAGDTEITNCTIIGNFAESSGGGIHGYGNTQPTISNSIIRANNAPTGPEMAFIEGLGDGSVSAWHSNVRDGQVSLHVQGYALDWDWGNIDADPCFADVDANDFHLKSQGGRWDDNIQAWVQDDVTSPCIDAGNPPDSIGLEPFPNGGIINMGAYGGTTQASKSYFGKPVCDTIVAGDVNGDCEVNFKDFTFIGLHWLVDNTPRAPGQATDPNPPDGSVGIRLDPVLSWTPRAGASSHDVYFGTESPGIFQGNQTETTFEPSTLAYSRTYYWRIDERNRVGTTTGPVWTFTTKSSGGR